MKKILITGADSYIGNAANVWLTAAGHEVVTLDIRTDMWRTFDFSPFDAVFHVAGIAHLKEKRKNKDAYENVNAVLPSAVANYAKACGVKQFIFMSSMSIYAGNANNNINSATPFKPKGYYGNSKLKADLALQEVNTLDFKVAILRPPMIFGKDCKGNFPRLVTLAKKLPLFPKIKNRRSMLYIDNLCEIIRLIVENESSGVFFPQNPEYFCSSDLVKEIAVAKDKKIRLTRLFNWAVWLFYPFLGFLKKLFGNLTYDMSLSNHFDGQYQIVNNAESVIKSVTVD